MRGKRCKKTPAIRRSSFQKRKEIKRTKKNKKKNYLQSPLTSQMYRYVAAPPLYLVKKGREFEYAWNDVQRDAAVQRLKGGGKEDSVHIQRYKGLGEMNAEQLWDTTLNPATRTLRKVTIENAAECDHIFSMLMGDEVAPRREFIEKNAKYARRIDV